MPNGQHVNSVRYSLSHHWHNFKIGQNFGLKYREKNYCMCEHNLKDILYPTFNKYFIENAMYILTCASKSK